MGQSREIAEQYFRAVESGDVNRALATLAPDAEFIAPAGRLPPEGVRGMLAGFAEAFPGNRFEVKNALESGDQVALEGDWVGSHRGPMSTPDGRTVPPTGKSVRIPFVT